MATETTRLDFIEGAAPATPAATRVRQYAKADGLMYSKDDAGTETLMSSGAAPTRASLGLATTDSPEFAGLNVGAAADTTITRTGAGDIAVEGNAIYRAGGTDVPIADGGTGASTKAAAFDALSPMTTAGDIIIGGASGTGTRLGAGTSTHVLTANGAGVAPSWQAAGGGGTSGHDLDTYTIDATYGDDFTSATLAAIWTRRNFVSGAETHQLGKNATYMRVATTGRATGDGYLQTAPSGDWTFAMAAVIRWDASITPWGIAVVDTAGTGVGTVFYNAPNALLVTGITTYSTYGGSFQQCQSWPAGSPQTNRQKIWISLRKSGTNYYTSYSFDGEIFAPESPAFSSAITVDRVGMLIHPLGAVGTDYVDIDWFNKIA